MYSLTTLALYTRSPCYSLPCRHYGDNPFFPRIHSWHISKPFLSLAYKASWIAYTELPASSEGCSRRSPDSLRESMLMLQGESVTNRFLNPKSFGKVLSIKISKLLVHGFMLSCSAGSTKMAGAWQLCWGESSWQRWLASILKRATSYFLAFARARRCSSCIYSVVQGCGTKLLLVEVPKHSCALGKYCSEHQTHIICGHRHFLFSAASLLTLTVSLLYSSASQQCTMCCS